MRKGLKRVLSIGMAAVMAASIAVTGGIGGLKTVNATAGLKPASSATIESILSTENYGIIASKYVQRNHTETNFAVKEYENTGGASVDVDLAGTADVPFIIGAYGADDANRYMRFGASWGDPETGQKVDMKYYLEVGPDIKDTDAAHTGGNFTQNAFITGDGVGKITLNWAPDTLENINSKIDNMISTIKTKSSVLASETATITFVDSESKAGDGKIYLANDGDYELDLTGIDAAGDSVVYIDVEDGSNLYGVISKSNALRIRKYSGTVVVFNLKKTTTDSEQLKLDKITVNVANSDSEGQTISLSTDTHKYNKTLTADEDALNESFDTEIAQKVIWNITNATNVNIQNDVGTFIVPTDNAYVNVKNSAGWVATAGTVNSEGEWHFIHKGRSEMSTSTSFKFSGRKAVTNSYDFTSGSNGVAEKDLVEDNMPQISASDFDFILTQTDRDYSTAIETGALLNPNPVTASVQSKNDGYKIDFPTINFTQAGTYYFKIVEDSTKTKDGYTNSDGEIDIQIDVKEENGVLKTYATMNKYITQEDKTNNKTYRKSVETAVGGNSWGFGAFYNLEDTGSLEISKEQDSTGADFEANKKFDFKVTFSNIDENIAEDLINHINPSEGVTVTPDESSKFVYTFSITKDQTVKFDKIPVGTKYKVEEVDVTSLTKPYSQTSASGDTGFIYKDTKSEAVFTNKYTLGEITVTKNVTGAQLPAEFNITNSFNSEKFTKGNATSTNPYTWTLKDVPVGQEVTFTENDYTVGNYDLKINDENASPSTNTVTVESSNWTSGDTATAAFTNAYTLRTGSIKVTKNVTGSDLSGYDQNKTYAIKVKFGNAGTYKVKVGSGSETDRDFATDTYETFNLKAGESVTISGVPQNTAYTVDEEDISDTDAANGYSKITSSEQTGTITYNTEKAVTVNNKYEAGKGTVQVTKSFSFDDGAVSGLPAGFKITNGYNGDVFNISNSTSGSGTASDPYVWEIKDVPEGMQITFTESGYDVTGYTVAATGSTTSAAVTRNGTAVAKLTNTYTREKVSSTVKKNWTDNNDSEELRPASVHAKLLKNGSPVDPETIAELKADNNWTATVDNLDKYDVPSGTENVYTWVETDVPSQYSAIYKDSDNNTVITNKYPAVDTGSLKITKAITGIDADDIALADKITFTVKSEDETYQKSFKYSDMNSGEYTLSGIPVGNYTVTESNCDTFTNSEGTVYTLSSSASKEKSAEVTKDQSAAVTFTNDYTKTSTNVDVKISKKAVGGGEELSGAKLTVTRKDSGDEVESWTSGSEEKTISLAPGTYILTETQAPLGYDKAEQIEFTVKADGTVTGPADNVNGLAVTMFDAHKTIKISKVDATNSKEVAGATLIIYKLDANGNKGEQIKKWTSSTSEIYEFELDEGDYGIEETIAPEGYEKATSLVKFNLTYNRTTGEPVIALIEGPGVVDSSTNKISFKNDPIKVTGKLSVHVVEELTGRDVPDAKVDVEYPDGTKKTYTTNEKGEIVDEDGNTPIDVPSGDYKVTVVQVPEGYEVTTGVTGKVTVPENGEGRHEAKIIPKTGGLKVTVLEEGTGREVPNATVEIKAPEGKTFPDGSTTITCITDENGQVTKYVDKDGNTVDLSTGLETGDYEIVVTKVPVGYKVTTGVTETVTVEKGKVAEHTAYIGTATTEKTDEVTDTSTTTTTNTTVTTIVNKSPKTGDMIPLYVIIGILAASACAIVAIITMKRRKEDEAEDQ